MSNNNYEAIIIDDSHAVRELFSQALNEMGFGSITAYPCITRGLLKHIGVDVNDINFQKGDRERKDIFDLQKEFAEEYHQENENYKNIKLTFGKKPKENLILFLDRELANGLYNLKDDYIPLNGDKFLISLLASGAEIKTLGISVNLKEFRGIEAECFMGNTNVKSHQSVPMAVRELSRMLAEKDIIVQPSNTINKG